MSFDPNTAQVFANGGYRAAAGAQTQDVMNPADLSAVGRIALCGPAQIGDALSAAVTAQRAWAMLDAKSRAAALHRVADSMESGAQGRVARAYVQDADLGTGAEAILLALDADAYESVVAGTSAAVPLRAALAKPSPIPTLVSTLVSADWPTGGSFQLPLPNQTVSFLRVGDRSAVSVGAGQ